MMWQADMKGAATWFSKSWLDFTGRQLEECLGDRWQAAIHPDDLELNLKRYEDALANSTSFSSEYRLLHHDGTYRWILGNGSPTHNANGSPYGYASSCVDITSRREAEMAFRLTQFAIDGAADAIFRIRSDATLHSVNNEACRSLGYTREELLKLKVMDFAEDTADVLKGRWQGFRATIKRIKHYTFEGSHRRKDGSLFPVEVTINYLEFNRQEFNCAFVRDISDAAIDAVVMVDAENRVAHWNPAAERMFGYSTEEIVNRKIKDVLTAERFRKSADGDWLTFCNLASGPTTGEIRELTGLRKDGSELPMELSVSGIQLDGRWWTVAIVRDITERKSAEQRLTKALSQAQAANDAKSEFLAVVSHEMRTPLNSIPGTLDLTMQSTPGDDQQQMLDMCRQSGTQLKALIDDVLDYSQFNAGRFSLQLEVMNLPEILERIRETFVPRAQEKGLEFRWQVEPEIPSLFWGDAARLYQVIDNLLNNAVKFTNTGYVAFRAQLDDSNEAGATLCFTVEDSGIGVPVEHRARISHRFEQVDNGSTRVFGGVGLGLSICAKLVELMGGDIRCEGVTGGGSRFIFNADFAEPNQQQMGEYRHRSLRPSAPEISFSGVHVLLAEDDPASSVVAKRMLENAGVVVTTVTDGRQVVEEFRRNPKRFSAIFMDIMMPLLDGIEATRQIRELQQTKIPVIALTAMAMEDDRERFLSSSLDAYLSKPIERNELLRTLRRVLARDNHQVQPDQQPSSGQKTAILDSVAWCRRCDDDAELLSEVSMLFGNTCDDAIKQIEESLDRKDQSGVVSAAHLLKGSVTNMCASQALHVSEQVELTARRSDLIGVNNLMPELKTEIQKLRQAIEDMFSASIDEADHHILARVQNQGASV